MNALEAKETIQHMYKGDPTIAQMDALEIVYKALDKQLPIEVKERKVLKDMYGHPYTIRGNCPACGSLGLLASNTDYCNACGQKLKWD